MLLTPLDPLNRPYTRVTGEVGNAPVLQRDGAIGSCISTNLQIVTTVFSVPVLKRVKDLVVVVFGWYTVPRFSKTPFQMLVLYSSGPHTDRQGGRRQVRPP